MRSPPKPPAVSCPTCACSPSSGQCLLPDQASANQSACPGGPGAQPFDPPTLWDGTCTAMGAVSSADSLSVVPPESPAASGCYPVNAGQVSIHGTTPALVCSGIPSVAAGTCGDQSMVCAFPKADGFMTCISAVGSQQCPSGWPIQHLIFTNGQACGCTCGDPIGDSCSSTLTVYQDSACSQPLGSVMVTSGQPTGCVDVASGSAFGSKSATPAVYTGGICTPSTLVEGAPLTVCCQP